MKTPDKIGGFVSLPVVCIGGMALLLVVASSSTMHAKKGRQVQPPEVENRTASFRLVSKEMAGDDLVLRFKNTSTLTITGYTLSLGQERIGADFFPNTAQKGVPPGAVEEVRIPVINLSTQSHKRITVLTVVFEDHTAEGDFQAARVIFDRRQGYEAQMRRIRSLLLEAAQAAGKGASTTPTALLKQIKDVISSLPEQDKTKPSPGKRSGLNFAKQWTLKQIAKLESGEMEVELQRTAKFSERAATLPKPFEKIGMGLEYIADRVGEILAKL